MVRLLKANVDDDDHFANDALQALDAASLTSHKAAGECSTHPKRLTAFIEGFSLNAGVKIHENDRQGRERLCLYGSRGAITLSRLTALPDGRVSYHMKRPLPDGRTHLVMTGVELLKKLAPLIPPPKLHILRCHGVFAPNAKQRSAVVPKPAPPTPVDDTTLLYDLVSRHVDSLVVCGLATDYRVKASVLDARRHGLMTFLFLPGVRPVELKGGDGDAAIAEMKATGALVLQ